MRDLDCRLPAARRDRAPLTLLNVDLQGPAGLIEAILDQPRHTAPDAHNAAGGGGTGAVRAARAVAVVCHPHPLFGGSMHNKVTYRLARGLRGAGFAVLRFNFRGVGRSAGDHDEGRGEADDLRVAMDWICTQAAGAPLLLAGYSFGSHVASHVFVEDPRALGLLAAGPALRVASFDHLLRCSKPKWLVAAEKDQFGEAALVERLVARMAPPVELTVVPGEEHSFSRSLEAVEARAQEVGRAFLELAGSGAA